MSMVELSELDGLKSKNLIGGLISRVKGEIPLVGAEVKSSLPENLDALLHNYQDENANSNVWLLIDDIDAKFQNTPENQAKVGSFFSVFVLADFIVRS